MLGKEKSFEIKIDDLKKFLMKGGPLGEEDEYALDGGTISACPNHVWFYADVVPPTVLKMNNLLIQMMKENLAEAAAKDREPDAIHLHINSPGGVCSSGFIAYDTIQAIGKKVPIWTHIEGHAASAATLLSLAGTKRFITPSSDMLIHEVSTWMWGNKSQLTEQYQNLLKVQNRIEEVYMKHSNFEREALKELLKRDTLIDANEAKERELVDEIATNIF